MNLLFVILIIITCAVIAFFVLIQNPKGGGLSGEFGGMGTQLMGAKQSTDIVEKGTWVGALVLLVLILGSFIMADKPNSGKLIKTAAEEALKNNKAAIPAAPMPSQPVSTPPASTSVTPEAKPSASGTDGGTSTK
jgi:preprotein translocase subunit SecG